MADSAPGREEGAASLQARVFLLVAARADRVKARSPHRPSDPVPPR
jgi:hypothetical protein